jgi:predicted phosphodiesterase
MVTGLRRCFLAFILPCLLLTGGCDNDILGLFASTDLDERLREQNTFNFLSAADRNISLGDAYSFIVLTDTHIFNGDTGGFEKLKGVIGGDVKFVVFNGDITQNGKKEDIEKFIQTAGSFGVPCYPVVGNHDIYFGNWPNWKELIGSTCYRVDGGGATLLILDSANAYFGAEQLDWLENELKKAKGRVFVFSHVNLFVESLADIQQFTDGRERARITSLLSARCDAMFMGHVHQRLIKELGGVKYITVEDYQGKAVYCQVWVSKNDIRWEFKKL